MKGVVGFAVGLLLGVGFAGVIGGGAGYVIVKRAESQVRRGWNLVPVVVYATDVATGDLITFDQVSQRSVPEQFVTSSVVKPDSASYVVNQRVLAPSSAGDGIRWTHFEPIDTKLSKEAIGACAAKFPPAGHYKTVAELKKGLGAP